MVPGKVVPCKPSQWFTHQVEGHTSWRRPAGSTSEKGNIHVAAGQTDFQANNKILIITWNRT